MKKILIITAVWQRHDLTGIVLNYYRSLRIRFPNMQLLVVGSEGEKSRLLCKGYKWNYIEAPNVPLSQKFNLLFSETEKYDFDFVILIGSDDLISEEIINFYSKNVEHATPNLIGLTDLYFHSLEKNKTIYFTGYNAINTKLIGAGRCFSRTVLEMCKFRLWRHEVLNRGLDTSSSIYMKKCGVNEIGFTMEQMGGVAVDLKHNVSITDWEYVKDFGNECNSEILEKFFPEQMNNIKKLKNDSVTTE